MRFTSNKRRGHVWPPACRCVSSRVSECLVSGGPMPTIKRAAGRSLASSQCFAGREALPSSPRPQAFESLDRGVGLIASDERRSVGAMSDWAGVGHFHVLHPYTHTHIHSDTQFIHSSSSPSSCLFPLFFARSRRQRHLRREPLVLAPA